MMVMKAIPEEQLEARFFVSDRIDYGQYVLAVKRYLRRIIGLAVFATLLVMIFLTTTTPKYSSKVSLLIEANATNISPLQEIYGFDFTRTEYLETQYGILRSRFIAEKTVAELSLFENPYFNQEYKSESKNPVLNALANTKKTLKNALTITSSKTTERKTEEQILASKISYAATVLMDSMSVDPIRNTQLVDISVETPDPKLSAEIANAVANVYIENHLEIKLQMTEKATEWLNTSLDELLERLVSAVSNLEGFDENNEIVNINGVVGLAAERVQQLSNELLEAQLLLKANKSLYDQINASNASVDSLASLPEVLNHPSMRDITLEQVVALSNVSELQEVYGARHPIMLSAQAELNSINISLEVQVRNLILGISTEYRETERNVAALENELKVAKTELRRLTSIENERKTLEKDVSINQQLYDSFFTRLNEADQIRGFESTNAKVLDEARMATTPSNTKKPLIVVITFIFSFGVGVAVAIVVDAINGGVRTVDDIDRKLGQKVLGVIPTSEHKSEEDLATDHYFEYGNMAFSESFRSMRTKLLMLNDGSVPKTVLVSSGVKGEGKSTVCINLAIALGQLHRVLIIDADLRSPSIAMKFSLPGYQPGLSNVITGTHKLNECIVRDNAANLHILTSGSIPANPQELLSSKRFSSLMEFLKGKFDCIVIDSAPTQALSDAVVVSRQCDSVVYVVEANSTRAKAANDGLSRFIEVGQKVDGIVLNKVDVRKAKQIGEHNRFYNQYA